MTDALDDPCLVGLMNNYIHDVSKPFERGFLQILQFYQPLYACSLSSRVVKCFVSANSCSIVQTGADVRGVFHADCRPTVVKFWQGERESVFKRRLFNQCPDKNDFSIWRV